MSKLKVAAFLILIASLSSCGGMQGGDIDRSKYEYRALKITDDYVDKIKHKYKKIKVLNVTAPGEFSSGLIEVSGVLRKARSSKKVSSDELSSIAISFLTSEETLSLHDPKTESFYQIAKAEYSPMYNDYKVIFMKYLYEVPFNEFIEVYITPEGLVKKLIVPIYPTSKEFLDVARGFSRPVLGVEDPIKKQAK